MLPITSLDDPNAQEIHLRATCRAELRDIFLKIKNGARSASAIIQAREDENSPWKWLRVNMVDVRGDYEQDRTVLGFIQNVDEFRSREEALRRQAELDSLTGLLNAGVGRKRVCAKIAERRRDDDLYQMMLVMDLDDFKSVNDTMGHMAGDEVLISFAGVLRETFRAEDMVCRLGGDEFMVYIDGLPNADDDVRSILDRLLRNVSSARRDHPALGCSVGAFVTNKEYSFEELYENADRALYNAKRTGKGDYSISRDV